MGFLSRPGAPRRGAQPRGAHLMLGEVSALRPAARTGEEGAASGEPAGRPAFAPETVFSPFWAFHALEVGQTEKCAAVDP